MTKWFYILLLFHFVFEFKNKNNFCQFKCCLICFESIFKQFDMLYLPSKKLCPIVFVMENFILRLLKNIKKKKKMILRKCVLSVVCRPKKKTNSVLTFINKVIKQ